MDQLLCELKGVNGQLELYDDKLVIRRKDFLSKMSQGFFKGEKTIYLDQIAGIRVKPGTMFTNGYIQFILPGGLESKRGMPDAAQDENKVFFENATMNL